MKIASISGITNYVKNIEATATFYSDLGFRLGTQDAESLTIYVNWFWIRFQLKDEVSKILSEKQDLETFLNLKVVDVDEFYEGVIAQGLKPTSQPEDKSWGHREFLIQDPDGYKLVFFQKTK